MEPQKQRGTDFLDLWKRSAPPIAEKAAQNERLAIFLLFNYYRLPLNGSRYLWTNLSQMAPSDQAVMMSKLISLWPYSKERRALNWPLHGGMITTSITASLIATKINADMITMDRNMRFLDAIRKCPKSPFIFSIYSSAIAYYVLQQTIINPNIYREEDPCTSCLITRSFAIGAFTGIIIPMISTPYLCHYVLMQRQNERFPEIKNMLEFFTLSFEGSKASRPLVAPFLVLHACLAAVAIYSTVWARARVFGTMEADPELAKELLLEVQSKPNMKEKMVDFLKKVPLLGGIVVPEPPEKEKI